jgi:hypothetical protein
MLMYRVYHRLTHHILETSCAIFKNLCLHIKTRPIRDLDNILRTTYRRIR